MFIAYGILVWPLKAARRACYWGLGRPQPAITAMMPDEE